MFDFGHTSLPAANAISCLATSSLPASATVYYQSGSGGASVVMWQHGAGMVIGLAPDFFEVPTAWGDVLRKCTTGFHQICSVARSGFAAGATMSVLEDSPLYVQQVAINVSAGAANEAFQCLSFVVSNCSDELLLYFDIAPHLHANGTLVFKTAHNAAGFIACNVSLVDCWGASSHGSFASSYKTLGFQVTAVNDAPTFTFTNITVLEDEYTNTSYESSVHIFSISQGSSHSHEQAQALSFVIARIEIESPELMLFQELPRILWLNNSNASISFRTAQHQFGMAYVHFYLQVFYLALLLLAHNTPGSLVFVCACLMGCRMTAGAHMMAYSILAYMSCTFTSRL
jgi:hypothetical protein